ncbi:MAG: cupin domain-containing protein, partial [Betaproteobacteria bacterium]
MTIVNKQLLGGLSTSAFLRRHWQKQALLVRGALPGFDGIVDFDTMTELACRDDCEARLVIRHGDSWTV